MEKTFEAIGREWIGSENLRITDANNNVFHGTITAPWNDFGPNWRGWYYPQLLTVPVDGTLAIAAGPLQ